jgi:excisionase family DNA binding protein
METYLSVKQAAELLQVHPETILRMIRRGDLAHVKVGTIYRISRDDIKPRRNPKPARQSAVDESPLARFVSPEWRAGRSTSEPSHGRRGG